MPNIHDYVNPGVQNAVNPHPTFGWAHGPIPNPNAGWTPPARTGPNPSRNLTPAQQVNPNQPGVLLNGVCGNICWIETTPGSGRACGQVFESTETLRRHLRNAHPGAVQNNSRRNIVAAARDAALDALRLYVRSHAWQTAIFTYEPGTGPLNGPINLFCDEMEEIAAIDPQFRATYGEFFHREPDTSIPAINKRIRCRSQVKSTSIPVSAYAEIASNPISPELESELYRSPGGSVRYRRRTKHIPNTNRKDIQLPANSRLRESTVLTEQMLTSNSQRTRDHLTTPTKRKQGPPPPPSPGSSGNKRPRIATPPRDETPSRMGPPPPPAPLARPAPRRSARNAGRR